MTESLQHKIGIAAGFFVLSLLFSMGIFYVMRLPDQQANQGHWVGHSREVIDQLDLLSLHLTQAETAGRGYLLTGQDRYLTAYSAAAPEIDYDVDHFRQLTADNDHQQKRVPALRDTIATELNQLAQAIDFRKNQNLTAAMQMVSDENNDAMTALRQQIQVMKNEERTLLQSRMQEWRKAADNSRLGVLSGGILMLALINIVFFAILRIARQRKIAAQIELHAANIQRAEAKRLAKIAEIQRQIVGHALNLETAMQIITDHTQSLTTADGSIVEMADGAEMVYRAASGTAALHLGLRLKAEGSLSGQCVRENSILNCEDSEADARVDREACRRVGLRSMVVVPLRHNGKAIGVLKVLSSQVNAFDADKIATLELIAGLLSATLNDTILAEELRRANANLILANAHLEQLATTDGLTGLKNHRTFQESFVQEYGRALRYKKPLSLVLLDVDHFKNFNDSFGHPAGDAVLKRIAGLLLENARTTDLVARYGGEEFALILPETDAQGARITAERILHAVTGVTWPLRPVTVSIGVGSLDANSFDNAAAMLDATDKALYAAKTQGRNQIRHYRVAA